jgi:hypothetical protein
MLKINLKVTDMMNMLSLLNQNQVMTIRQLVLAHAGGKYRPGGKNYRLVRKLIDRDMIFQIGDNLFVKG